MYIISLSLSLSLFCIYDVYNMCIYIYIYIYIYVICDIYIYIYIYIYNGLFWKARVRFWKRRRRGTMGKHQQNPAGQRKRGNGF